MIDLVAGVAAVFLGQTDKLEWFRDLEKYV
jgi:hypothetical protein